jgi:tRNA (guanine37-N1)-methyltransferase
MRFDVISIFPEIFSAYLNESIIKRAIQKDLININIHNLRDYAKNKHKSVDDYPYGGGAGMVMKPEPFFDAVDAICPDKEKRKVIMLSPSGSRFDQTMAMKLSGEKKQIILLCGRYEAVDERVTSILADEEISIGDYILTGGELPALVIIDAVTRLIPGVLGDEHSIEEESFSWGILDYPHYTRPPVFRGYKVPEVLLSGNHKDIQRWRRKEALRRTITRRPDLLVSRKEISNEDHELLKEIKEEELK